MIIYQFVYLVLIVSICKKHLYFETKPLKNKDEYQSMKDGWKIFRSLMWDLGRGENSVLKTKSTLNEFFIWNKENKDKVEGKSTYNRKSLKGKGSNDPFYIHFLDCIINNKKGIKIDLNKKGFSLSDFIFRINVLYEMGSSSDNQIRQFCVKRAKGIQTVKKKLSRNFSVVKSKWKSKQLNPINLEETSPYEYNDISKKYYNFLSVLKEGRDKNTKMYVENFKDLEIERFVEKPNKN